MSDLVNQKIQDVKHMLLLGDYPPQHWVSDIIVAYERLLDQLEAKDKEAENYFIATTAAGKVIDKLKASNALLREVAAVAEMVIENSYYGHDDCNLDVRDRDKLVAVLAKLEVKGECK